jgi:hypothetical protein
MEAIQPALLIANVKLKDFQVEKICFRHSSKVMMDYYKIDVSLRTNRHWQRRVRCQSLDGK